MEASAITEIIIKLIIIVAAARFAGILAKKCGLPSVFGEIVTGIILGPSLYHFIIPSNEPILLFLAEIGIILLLFEVGLESNLEKLLGNADSSILVAIFGSALPFLLGYIYAVSAGVSTIGSVLIGVLLSATSVGISMRVFLDANKLHSRPAEVVLGAAIIDDILGLIFFSILVGLVQTGTLKITGAITTAVIAAVFLILSIVIGRKVVPLLYRIVEKLNITQTFLISEFVFALFLSLIANAIGLATIIWAFAAGLILEHTKYKNAIEEHIHPLSKVFVPIFFVMAGANLNLLSISGLTQIRLIVFLLIIAIVGKLASGFLTKGTLREKLIVGCGMLPRGEVALILAAFGITNGLLSEATYAAIVIMIMATTIIAPFLLKTSLGIPKNVN